MVAWFNPLLLYNPAKCVGSRSLSDELLDDHLPLFLGQPREGGVVVGGQRRGVPIGHRGAVLVVLGSRVGAQVVGKLLFGLGLGVEQVLNL